LVRRGVGDEGAEKEEMREWRRRKEKAAAEEEEVE
jgi:hypothetical protein